MSANTKRRHKTLTLREKMDILQRLEKKESPSQLAKEYGVGRATLHDIKKKKMKIVEHFETMESVEEKRKTMKGGDYPEMETALFKWFLKERAKRKSISGDGLKAKAREFYKNIMKKDDFQASAGWLDKFKKRYGIRLQCNTFSNSIYAVQDLLKDKIDKLGLTPDQVYTAKESTILWQMLPTKIPGKSEGNDPNDSRDRIHFMPCANASGKHKFDMMVIGQSEDPDVCLPVNYKNHFTANITSDMLKQWFYEEFIPGVKEFMKSSDIPEKALLILYDASGNLKAEYLKSKDGNIQTMILPPNCSQLLQPMSHIIQTVRSRYKKKLITEVVAQGGDISENLKKVNMKDVLFALANAWNSISAYKIKWSWEKLWPAMVENEERNSEEEEKAEEVLPISIWLKILGDKNLKIGQKQLTAWFTANDEEIEQQEEEICTNDLLEVVIEEEELPTKGEEVQQPTQPKSSVNSNEALECFSKCISWAEENGVSGNDVMVLRNLREKALKQGQADKKCVTD